MTVGEGQHTQKLIYARYMHLLHRCATADKDHEEVKCFYEQIKDILKQSKPKVATIVMEAL